MVWFPADRRSIVLVPVALIILGIAAIIRTRRRFDRRITNLVDSLSGGPSVDPGDEESDMDTINDIVVTEEDLDTLPAPVERYLNSVLEDDQRFVESVQLSQRGEFRFGDSSNAWKPFQATQHFASRSPGFVWDATIDVFPSIPVRVVDAYVGGEGTLQARLLSAIPMANAESGPEMDAGELMRYLGESVWFPTALLSDDIEWEAIDERSARARIEDGETSVSLVFQFSDDSLVESVHAEERYRQEDERHEPWTGYFQDYQERNGLLIPINAEVEWNLPKGDHPYWRATVEDIDYEFAS